MLTVLDLLWFVVAGHYLILPLFTWLFLGHWGSVATPKNMGKYNTNSPGGPFTHMG